MLKRDGWNIEFAVTMITLRKLKIYKKYDGDSTQHAREHYRNENTEMSAQD